MLASVNQGKELVDWSFKKTSCGVLETQPKAFDEDGACGVHMCVFLCRVCGPELMKQKMKRQKCLCAFSGPGVLFHLLLVTNRGSRYYYYYTRGN